MSRKRKKPKLINAQLKVGSFYNTHDGSKQGHPGRIEIVDQQNDIYISVTTRSLSKEEFDKGKFRKDYKELKFPTSNDIYKSLVHRRPFKGSRFDYGKEYPNLKIDKRDEKTIKSVLSKNPRLGYWYKKRKK